MTQCPSCGSQVSGKFCPNCGAQVTQVPPVAAAAMQPSPDPTAGQAPRPPQAPQMPPGFPPQPPRAGQPVMPPQPPAYPGQAPYPGSYPGVAPTPKKGGGVLKAILIILGVVLGLFILLIVIGSLLPDEEGGSNTPAASTTVNGTMGTPVISDQVDEVSQKPARSLKTVPPSTEEIYAAIEVNVKAGQVLGAKWYYQNRHQAHLDTELDVDADFKGWASFNIGNAGDPWPAGSYKVELFIDGQLKQTATFDVK